MGIRRNIKMDFCSKCGKQLDENSKFCTGCGAPVGMAQTNQNGSVRPEYSTAQVRKTDFSEDFASDDKRENRAVAAVSYVGPMFFLPLVATPNSKFARFHANQGVTLFMLSLAYGVVYKALLWFFSEILIGASLTKFSFSYFGYGAATTVYGIISLLLTLVWGVVIVLFIIGIVNALKGKAAELPVIGKIRFFK